MSLMLSPISVPDRSTPENSNCDIDTIPYHAREYARPFTYGALPKGIKNANLHHVKNSDKHLSILKKNYSQNIVPDSPPPMRRSNRPSVTSSPTVLRKTPSREEFEEMLIQRREQALKQPNIIQKQHEQKAAIQKELDQLQLRLTKEIQRSEIENLNNAQFSNWNTGKEEHSSNESAITDTFQGTIDKKNKNSTIEISIVEQTRPQTPSFPTLGTVTQKRCVSPYSPKNFDTIYNKITSSVQIDKKIKSVGKQHFNNDPQEVDPNLVQFAKACSEYWYKPYITREEAVRILRNAEPGAFLIRNSLTYKEAYGLALRVATPPPGVNHNLNDNAADELVRHFLLEPTVRGVRLKACASESVFTSLSAFVYQHSITPLALPCKLKIPYQDILLTPSNNDDTTSQKQVIAMGAACNVLYLYTCNTESLTGDEAVRKAVCEMLGMQQIPNPIEVHFKVAQQGITITDNSRRVFFRRHYTTQNISHIGIDPDDRYWCVVANDEGLQRNVNKTIFAFVARSIHGFRDNECHIFCDLATSQPAQAIVAFTQKVLSLDTHTHKLL